MSNKFEDSLKATLKNEMVLSENGANMFKTSGHALLDLNFAVSSLRNTDEDEIKKMFSNAFFEDSLLATKWLFFARDVRGGMGERRLFRICFSWLANTRPNLVKKLIPLVATYGRFDDIFNCGLEEDLWNTVVDFIAKQLKEDIESEHPSLLAKWLPSVNTSSPKTCSLAKKLRKSLGMDEKTYRKILSSIRKKLNVVEVDASANNWSKIDYNIVPSMANLKYKNAFLKHDEIRRKKYLEDLNNPQSSDVKINSSATFPYEILSKYIHNENGYIYYGYGNIKCKEDLALEAMWKALPNYIEGKADGSTMCVVDTSASMTASVGGTQTTALDVAHSLGIYFSERLSGPFKNKFISFSEYPKYIDMSNAKSLIDKIKIAYSNSEVSNTDIYKTFMLILETAIKHNLKQEDLPSNLLILSDMNFDAGTHQYDEYSADKCSLMTEISDKFAKHGYKLPKLVYWNIIGGLGRKAPIPIQTNEAGVVLVSGFSPAIANMVFSAKLDPYDALVDTLSVKRYDIIEEAYKEIES